MTSDVGFKPDKKTLFSTTKADPVEPIEPVDDGGKAPAPETLPSSIASTRVAPTLAVRDEVREIAGANENRVRMHLESRFQKTPVLRDRDGFVIRDPNTWRADAEQHREGAEEAIAAAARGRSNAPIHVGHWSSFEHAGKPVFFQNIPSDQNPTSQVYAYWDPNEEDWTTYEVAGGIARAYADPKLTDGRLGTGSWLGYPTSRAFAAGESTLAPFKKDPAVETAIASGRSVTFQQFEGGYLVDLGDGTVRAYDTAGALMGTSEARPKRSYTIM